MNFGHNRIEKWQISDYYVKNLSLFVTLFGPQCCGRAMENIKLEEHSGPENLKKSRQKTREIK